MYDIIIHDVGGRDIRFPTSRTMDGSDAVNRNPDHSLAYAVVGTSLQEVTGYGITFTIGQGNDLVVDAIREYGRLLSGRRLSDIVENMGKVWHELVNYSPLRWLGPEKGITHLAIAAVFNALWDLYGKVEQKPVWKLIVDMSPGNLLNVIDFHYVEDVLTRDQAYELLARIQDGKWKREEWIKGNGYPSYTTSAGWIGFSDDKLRRLLREKIALGWQSFKINPAPICRYRRPMTAQHVDQRLVGGFGHDVPHCDIQGSQTSGNNTAASQIVGHAPKSRPLNSWIGNFVMQILL